MSPAPLIERYRDRLSLEPGDPVVTLNEGSTPLVEAPRLSERIGVRAYLKFEGANPTGSFKDRGMTVAVSRAKGSGAEAVICASTGNTAASAAAYAARAGMRGAVIVPEGKIAIGKLAQALMHGARVVALQGNFDDALRIVRELADKHPIELVNSVNPHRIEGQKTAAFEVIEELGEAPGALAIPVGNAGNVTAYWRGFQEAGTAPILYGFQAEGAAPLVRGEPVANPETVASAIRIGNPARWEEAMDAFTASRGRVAAVTDEQILDAYRWLAAGEGVFCEPASAASVAGLLAHGLPTVEGEPPPETVVCVLTGHGLKDPDTALSKAPAGDQLRERPQRGRARGIRVTVRRRLVRVPASSANLGPGYDVLAAAVSLYLELEVEETGEFSLDPGGLDVSTGRDNLIVRAFETLHPADGIAFRLRSEIPLARGLGSSAAAIVAGLFAADHLFELGPLQGGDAGQGDRAGGPPRQRRRGDLRRLRDLRRGEGDAPSAVRFDPPERPRGHRRDPGRRGLDRARPRGDPRRGPARRRRRQRLCRLPPRPRPADEPTSTWSPPASPTASTSPAAASSIRARWSWSTTPPSWAPSARRSPAPAPPSSSGPPGRTPARSPRPSRHAAPAGPRSAASPSARTALTYPSFSSRGRGGVPHRLSGGAFVRASHRRCP